MHLRPKEMTAIWGLVHYLNESFDGHGIVATVQLSTPDCGFADKGEISGERIESEPHPLTMGQVSPTVSFLYTWGTGDD